MDIEKFNKITTPELLLDFMSKNIEYGYIGQSGKVYNYNDKDFQKNWFNDYFLQKGDSVLITKIGTCWDQVELERMWFKSHNYKFYTLFEMVLLDYSNNYPTHSFLVYQSNNNNWCWFENADYANRGIHRFLTLSELLNFQNQKYKESLIKLNIKNDELKKIILTNYNEPYNISKAAEYLDFVIDSKKV